MRLLYSGGYALHVLFDVRCELAACLVGFVEHTFKQASLLLQGRQFLNRAGQAQPVEIHQVFREAFYFLGGILLFFQGLQLVLKGLDACGNPFYRRTPLLVQLFEFLREIGDSLFDSFGGREDACRLAKLYEFKRLLKVVKAVCDCLRLFKGRQFCINRFKTLTDLRPPLVA